MTHASNPITQGTDIGGASGVDLHSEVRSSLGYRVRRKPTQTTTAKFSAPLASFFIHLEQQPAQLEAEAEAEVSLDAGLRVSSE